jgi:predicted nucleotidyltransferase
MDLEKLMSSPERVRIIQDVLLQGTVTNKGVSDRTATNKGLVSIYLNNLVLQGFLSKEGRSYKVKDSANTRALKRFLNLTTLTTQCLETSWARGIGCYGSWADGTNTIESDVVVWVIVDVIDNEKIAQFRKALSDRTRSEVNILVLTDEKIRSMREQDTVFYRNLIYGSVVLAGEKHL